MMFLNLTKHPLGWMPIVWVLVCVPSIVSAQLTSIDEFNWDVASTTLRANLSLSPRYSYTTWSDAIGREADVVMTMPVVVDTAAEMALIANGSSLRFQSTAGASSQWFVSYDGIDGSADTVRATSGLRGFDLTEGGFRNQFAFRAFNWGGPLNIGFYVLSDTTNISQALVPVSSGIDTVSYNLPFESFVSSGASADFSNVNAIVVVVGANGGAEGPVDLQLMNFGTNFQHSITTTGDTVLYDQRDGIPGGQWFTNQFSGPDAAYSAEAADDFTVSASATWRLRNFTIEGNYISGPGPNPTARLSIISDNNGAPVGDTLVSYPALPVIRSNPFFLPLPDTGVGLPTGTYWFTLTLNAPPGTEGYFRGSPTEFGNSALWRNPNNGFGFQCTGFTPLSGCNGNDQSFLFSIGGEKNAPGADVAVEIAADKPGDVALGDTIVYTVTVKNVGELESPDTDVQVNLTRLGVVSVVSAQGSCTSGYEDDVRTAWSCSLGSLGAGESTTITFLTVANISTTNGVSVVFKPEKFPDEVAENNTADIDGYAIRSLSITKSASDKEFLVGSEIVFGVTVRNEGTSPVNGVYVEDYFQASAYNYVSDTGGCVEYEFEDAYLSQQVTFTGLRCEIGTMAPGEERHFDILVTAREASSRWQNKADAYSDRGKEDDATISVELKGELAYAALILRMGVVDPRLFEKTAVGAIDVYLDQTLLADDLEWGFATPFTTVPVTSYPPMLYLVPSDAPDRTSAFDSLEVPLGGVTEGTGAALVLTTDGDSLNRVVLVNHAKLKAENPDGATFAFVHAAASVPTVTPVIMGDEITPVLLETVAFGERTDYYPWETVPAAFNLHVSPVSNEAEEEVYKVDLPTAGLSYLLVLAPDTALGKLDHTNLYVVDSEGETSVSAIVTSTEEAVELPDRYALHANYPNPFNPETKIVYELPESGPVQIVVYDVSGRRVSTLFDGMQVAGTHSLTWRGQSDTGMPIASGVYIYRMTSGSFVASKTMLLMK